MFFAAGDVAQETPHDLAATRLGQGVGEADVVRDRQRADFFTDVGFQFLLQCLVGLALADRDKHADRLAFDLVGAADSRRFGDARVAHERTFYFYRTETMPGDVDYVIDPPHDPVVSILVASRVIASEVLTRHLGPVLLLIAVVAILAFALAAAATSAQLGYSSLTDDKSEKKKDKDKKKEKSKSDDKDDDDDDDKKDKDKNKESSGVRADSVIAAKATSSNAESEVDKKKKKDKQKGKGIENERIKAARVRAWGGIIATVISVVLTVTISIIVSRTGNQPTAVGAIGSAQQSKKLINLSDSNKISGGKYEASGAVAVPNANGILFVDDSKPDQVLYMPVNQLGDQDGPVMSIPLGVTVENPEGISQFGSRFMIIGSLSTLV